jgi:hypothetical protein
MSWELMYNFYRIMASVRSPIIVEVVQLTSNYASIVRLKLKKYIFL